jgi:hypothetical protein
LGLYFVKNQRLANEMFFSKLIISFFLIYWYSVISPEEGNIKKPITDNRKTDKEIDSTSILNAFKNGILVDISAISSWEQIMKLV